jgi:aminoglycoside phosphotransferase (APT) family kinase protein
MTRVRPGPGRLCHNRGVQTLEAGIASYLAHQVPGASEVRVASCSRIHGGASRETYRVRASWTAGGARVERGLIVRRDPPGSLIETDRRTEYFAYRAFFGSRVPVPEPLWLEEDPRWLERPFFVMEELTGCEASPQVLLAPPYAEKLERIGAQKWTILGEISKADPGALGLRGRPDSPMHDVAPEDCWRRELDHWTGVIDADELCPQPIGRAAIRWLRRNPPPPAQRVSVVHADFRTGNFLVDREGTIRGILDWEMAHLGDPLEDLAWSINRTWCWARDDRAGGLLPRERAIALWEQASGLRADPVALHWWDLFSSVKGLAIWISSGREYLDGKNRDPLLGFTGWWLPNAQDRAILETMGKLK